MHSETKNNPPKGNNSSGHGLTKKIGVAETILLRILLSVMPPKIKATPKLSRAALWKREHRAPRNAFRTPVANSFSALEDECVGFEPRDKDSKRTIRQLNDKIIARICYANARDRLRVKQMRKRLNKRLARPEKMPDHWIHHPSPPKVISPIRKFLREMPKNRPTTERLRFARIGLFLDGLKTVMKQTSMPDNAKPQGLFMPDSIKDKMEDSLTKFDAKLDTLEQSIGSACMAATNVATTIDQVIKNFFISSSLDSMIAWLALFMDFCIAVYTNVWTNIISMIMRFVAYAHIPSLSVSFMMTWMQEYLPKNSMQGGRPLEEGEDISQREDNATANSLDHGSWPLLLIALCGSLMIGQLPSKQQSLNIANSMKSFPILMSLTKSVPDMIGTVVEILPEAFQAWYRSHAPLSWATSQLTADDPFFKWIAEVEDLSVATYTDESGVALTRDAVMYNVALQQRVLKLYLQGKELRTRITLEPLFTAKASTQAFEAWKKISELHNRALRARCGMDVRPTPFVVCVGGLPGLGKSGLAPVIAKLLYDGPIDEHERIMYQRNEACAHWDGYTGQFCTVFDDFGQFKDGGANADPYQELVLMASSAPYILTMASLPDKGTTFSSRLVILNTNNPYPGTTSLQALEPYLRRRNLVLDVKIRPGFEYVLNDRTNPSSGINALNVDPAAPLDHLIFHETNKMDRDKQIGPSYSYLEVLALVKERFISHEKKEQAAGKNFESALREARLKFADNAYPTMLTLHPSTSTTSPKKPSPWFWQRYVNGELSPEPEQKFPTAPPRIVRFILSTGIDVYLMHIFPEGLTFDQWHSYRKAAIAASNEDASLRAAFATCANQWEKDGRITALPTINVNFNYTPPDTSKSYWNQLASVELSVQDWLRSNGKAILLAMGTIMAIIPLLVFAIKGLLSTFRPREDNAVDQAGKSYYCGGCGKHTDYNTAFGLFCPSVTGCGSFVNIAENFLELFQHDTKTLKEYACSQCDKKWLLYSIMCMKCEHCEGVFSIAQGRITWRPQIASGDQRTAHAKKFNRVLRRPNAIAQFGNDRNASVIISHKILPNMVRMVINTTGGTMNGFMLRTHLMVIPSHFFLDKEGKIIPNETQMTLTTEAGASFDLSFDIKRLIILDAKKDLCLYTVERHVQPFKDITAHFITDEDLTTFTTTPGTLLTLRLSHSGYMAYALSNLQVDAMDSIDKAYCQYSRGEKRFSVLHGWVYATRGIINGDCGGVLIAENKFLQRKIMGIHVAAGADNSFGSSELVTMEMLKPHLDNARPTALEMPTPPYVIPSLDDALLIPEGNFTYLGVVPKDKIARGPEKTDICPSLLHNKIFQSTTAPSVLHPRDPRMLSPQSPLRKAVEKYAGKGRSLDESLLEQIAEYIGEEFRLETNTPHRILTDSEAINGIPTEEYIDPIDFSTAPGYPYILEKPHGARGKRHLFTFDDNDIATISDSKLADRLKVREMFALRGIRVPSVFLTTLKDERRPIAKIEAGKTRVFTIGPVDYTLLFRKYVLPFLAHMYRARLKTCSAIGINCESTEWTQLTHRLYRNGIYRGFSADYGNFDGSIPGQIFMFIVQVINKWFCGTAEEDLVREVLFSEVLHTCQLSINTMYFTHVGGPSGYPGTAPINTLVAKFECCYVWMKNLPPTLTLHDYHYHVNDVIYGDDVKCGVSDEASPYFNITSFNRTMQPFGRTLTMADKTATITENGPLDCLSFLKRKTRMVGAHAMPLMDPDTICELTNWIRTCEDPFKATVDNCNAALSFAFFYGRDAFETLRGAIVDTLHSQRLHAMDVLSFGALYTRYVSDGMCFPDIYNNNFLITPEQTQILDPLDSELFATSHDNPFIKRMIRPDNSIPTSQEAAGTELAGNHELGVIFDTQRTTDTESAGHSNPVVSSIKQPTAHDHSWTIGDTSHRPSFTKSGTWSVAAGVATVLERLEVPLDFVTSAVGRTGWNIFALWRGGLKIRIEVNGTRMHVGKLIAYYVPLIDNTVIAVWHEVNFSATTSIQHCFLDAATNNAAELIVSYIQISNYISTERSGPGPVGRNYLGNFRLQVFNPLLAGTGSPQTLAYVITAEFLDSQFQVPKPMPLTVEEDERRLKEAKENVQRYTRALGRDTLREHTLRDNARPTMMNIVKKMLPKNTKGDQIDIAGVVDLASSVAGLMMDKPTDSSTKPAFYRQPMQYLNHSSGIEYSNLLTLDPSALTTAEFEHFGTTQDEMSLTYLLRTPTWDSTFVWNMTQAPGTLLFQREIGPLGSLAVRERGGLPNYPQLLTRFRVNCCDYFTLPFMFWRGGWKIKITMSASQFATGRLFLGWQYMNFRSMGTTLADLTGQYGVYIDLENEVREWSFEIPFLTAYNGWLRVCHGAVVDVNETTVAINPSQLNKFFLGTFYLVVVNNLVVPDTIPGSVYINMFISGGKDYEVMGPSDSNATIVPMLGGDLAHPSSTKQTGPQAQFPKVVSRDDSFEQCDNAYPTSGNDDAATTVISMQEDAGPGLPILPMTSPFIDNQLGERLGSVKDCIKRGTPLYSLRLHANNNQGDRYTLGTAALSHSTIAYVPIGPPFQHIPTSPFLNFKGMFGFFAMSYAAWRGNINYTVMFQQDRNVSMRNFVAFQPTDDTMKFRIRDGSGFENPDTNTVNNAFFNELYGSSPELYASVEQTVNPAALKPNIIDAGYTSRGTFQAIDYSDDGANYCKVSIPYHTINKVMLNDFRYTHGEYLDQTTIGALIVGSTYREKQNGPTPINDSYTDAFIYINAADNFRFGVFLGPHFLSVRSFPEIVTPFLSTNRWCGMFDRNGVTFGDNAIPQMLEPDLTPEEQQRINIVTRTIQGIRHEWDGHQMSSQQEKDHLIGAGFLSAGLSQKMLERFEILSEHDTVIVRTCEKLNVESHDNQGKSTLQIWHEYQQFVNSCLLMKGEEYFATESVMTAEGPPYFHYRVKAVLFHLTAEGRAKSPRKKDAQSLATLALMKRLQQMCEGYRLAGINVGECATLLETFQTIHKFVGDFPPPPPASPVASADQQVETTPKLPPPISPDHTITSLGVLANDFVVACGAFGKKDGTHIEGEIALLERGADLVNSFDFQINRIVSLKAKVLVACRAFEQQKLTEITNDEPSNARVDNSKPQLDIQDKLDGLARLRMRAQTYSYDEEQAAGHKKEQDRQNRFNRTTYTTDEDDFVDDCADEEYDEGADDASWQ